MGAYNILTCPLQCPRCGVTSEMEVEFRFGWANQIQYSLGDALDWGKDKARKYKLPTEDPYQGEGYVECPNCEKDVWVVITVQSNVIAEVRVEPHRPGYKT